MNGGWRSPALSNVSSSRYQDSDAGNYAGNLSGLGSGNSGNSFGAGLSSAGLGGFNGGLSGQGMGLGMNAAALGGYGNGFGMLNNMNGMNGMMGAGLNMNAAAAMGIQPGSIEAQILAAQLSGQLNGTFSPGLNGGFNGGLGGLGGMGMGMGVQGQPGGMAGRGNPRGLGAKSSARSTAGSSTGGGASASKDPDDVDPELLKDTSQWLRSLRLHKYTPNFDGMKWQDMVVMGDTQLEQQGVAALGARRKLLKHFEAVRNKMGIDHPKGSTPSGDADSGADA